MLHVMNEGVVQKFVVGLCFDGASTYQGEYNGVGEILRKSNSEIKKYRDRMQIEGTALSKVPDQIKQYAKVTILINNLRVFIGSSPKRQKKLEKLHHQKHKLDIVEEEVRKKTESIARSRK